MNRYVVINMLLGIYVVAYLRQKPEAGHVMIDRISHEIEAGSKGQFCYRQVVIVIGKLYDDGDKLEDIPFKRRNTIAWEHHYLVSDDQSRITRATDRIINRIIRKSMQELLEKFYLWRLTSTAKKPGRC